MTNLRFTSLSASALVLTLASVSGQSTGPPAPEQEFEIRLIERPVGVERVRYSSAGGGQRLDSGFNIVDRGTPMAATSQLTVGGDFTPRAFDVKGKTYRFVNVDVSVTVENGIATSRDVSALPSAPSRTTVGDAFFVSRGYAPLAGRAWLVRYWETHGRPREMRSVPSGASSGIRVAFQGDEHVQAGGASVHLRRYSVDGVVWGRETVWVDDDGRLAAIVTRIHILPLEAIRTDLRAGFPALQASAVADRMRDLAQMRTGITPVADGGFALVGVTVVSGAAPPLADATLVVRDGTIAAVGPRASTVVPPGVKVLDATGAVVVPGLWDMHAHAANIEWAPAYAAAGVTTVRDMGGETRYLTAFRDALNAGRGVGPRMLLAGLIDGPGEGGFGTVVAGSPDEGRAVVDRYRMAGFQQMKLYTLVAPDVVSAITEYAHRLGLTVTGHVPRALTPEQGIERGMDQIAHLPVRGGPESADSRRLIAALARHRTVVDPTLAWTELLGRGSATPLETIEPAAAGLPAPLAENYRSVTNAQDAAMAPALASVKAMFDAGVPVVTGTDGAIPGLSVLREIELFVRAGLTPQQAIDAATRVPAQAMGLLAETGTIEPGKRADLLVLDADPLADIRNLRRARWVSTRGVLFACADAATLAGFTRPR